MVKEEIKDHELENDDIHRLLMSLNRIEAPKDFDFKVRARITGRRLTDVPRSWLPSFVRAAVPAALVLAVGGYVGFWAYSEDANSPTIAVAEPVQTAPLHPAQPEQAQPLVEVPSTTEAPAESRVVDKVDPSSTATADTLVKPPKRGPSPLPGSDKPAGGSYDVAGTGSKTINRPQQDEDDLANEIPTRRVLVSASEFLKSAGISATSTGSGGKITAVNGTAASVGVKVGDVIEWVNVQTRSIRVAREGKSLTFQIR